MISIDEQSGIPLTCKGCGRKIRYDIEDVQHRHLSEHVHEDDISYSTIYTECSIACPLCGYKNIWIGEQLSY